MRIDSTIPSNEDADDKLLEQLLVVLDADGDGKLAVLRSEFSGAPQRFEELLRAARLYQAGRRELRQGHAAHTPPREPS